MKKRWGASAEFIFIALLYAALTIAFLSFAVKPSQFSTHLQTLDSVLAAAIVDHVIHAPFNPDLTFWEFGIFYPVQKTLCLSEPMITSAIFAAPFIWIIGYAAASNLWMYFCWWSLAVSFYAYLRHIKFNVLSAFWGGLFLSFNADRMWHAAGHSHLYYQAGLFLSLIGLQRLLSDGRKRWKFLFAAGLLSQVFAGIYLSVITAAWAVIVFPIVILVHMKAKSVSFRQLLKPLFFVSVVIVAGLTIYAPILVGYMEFGKDRAHNSLEQLVSSSATLAGYLIPPASPERLVTLGGLVLQQRVGNIDGGEDTQFVGIVTLALLLLAFAMAFKKPDNNLPSYTRVLLGAIAIAGAVAFILSLGPYLREGPPPTLRLPFAYLYAWLEPLRFFRAPARFAIAFNWSIAIIAAYGLHKTIQVLKDSDWHIPANVLGISCIALTALETYPVNSIYRVDVAPSPFAQWSGSQKDNRPFVTLPVDSLDYLAQMPWHHGSLVNGYSGYAPLNKLQELAFFESNFPGPEALSVMDHWGIKRVFLQTAMESKTLAALDDGKFKKMWSGAEGILLELTTKPLSWDSQRATRIQELDGNSTLLKSPLSLISMSKDVTASTNSGVAITYWGMEKQPAGDFRYNANASVGIGFTQSMLSPAHYKSMKITYTLTNWYNMRESGSLYWSNTDIKDLSEKQKVEFVLLADGQSHELTVPLDKSIAWSGAEPVRLLRLDLGTRPGTVLQLESLKFE